MAGKRTAVVLVHGMGEQRPMETLWSFVDAVWTHDPNVVALDRREVWSHPSPVPGNYELRRVTTRGGLNGKRVDFYEFYWAHLMAGNTVAQLRRWLVGLLVRRPSSVPARLKGVWVGGTAFLVMTALLLLGAAFAPQLVEWFGSERTSDPRRGGGLRLLLAGCAAVTFVATMLLNGVLVPVAGDAARYFSPVPENVEARQKIREAGVDLLERLTRSGFVDRIVLVAHSLGTTIAYDVLTHAWGKVSHDAWRKAHDDDAVATALAALQTASRALYKKRHTAEEIATYRDCQRAYSAALSDADAPWLVSDFVSLGSPLSKGDVLMSRDADAFELRKARREFPTCPPVSEGAVGEFTFDPDHGGRRIPHHAAPFAPTVWTNIAFEHRLLFLGDVVAGPVRALFGSGIRDIVLPAGSRFRHLDYWKGSSADVAGAVPAALAALRRALNLRGESERAVWGNAGGRIGAADLAAPGMPPQAPMQPDGASGAAMGRAPDALASDPASPSPARVRP
ncbi:hypothetical protein [Sphingomonas corticis]|uniref:Alpha/beta hydrolase n=1 Tax=Sphingomonas corticis TaxID=2722791 RepID=A0ABX1CTT0_9SPHN|nr:hypothetical protein [Sphingomonas corticis]NJR80043.1 hypothetical protein [Sphingomonas corticis]